MSTILSLFVSLTILIAFHSSHAVQLDESRVRRVLAKAMRCQNITQLHSAIVHGNDGLYSFRLRLNPDGSVSDVTGPTLLPIASVSKGMFCSALVRLEQHLKASDPNFNLFTTPIKKLMGDDFWFLDQRRTDAVTLQDLVSHTTGLERHDTMTMLGGARTKEDVYRRTCQLTALHEFRASFVYNNLAYSVVDFVVEKLTGRPFTSYMREFLWQPLGMQDTRGSTEMDEQSLRAVFATVDHSAYRSLLDRSLDVSEAAGGIFPSLNDMIKYMRYHLDQLKNSSLQPPLKPFKAVNAEWVNMYMFLNKELFNEGVKNVVNNIYESYGYGWVHAWYRGNLVLEHGGSYVGAKTELELYPDRQLGVFTNTMLGDVEMELPQAGYATILNKFIVDLMLQHEPFVTEENVCELFNFKETPPIYVTRRQLTPEESEMCTGSFGAFGYGVVRVARNASSGLLNAHYGLVVLELLSIHRQTDASVVEFFASILSPTDLNVKSPILSSNRTHLKLRTTPLTTPSLFIKVWRQDGKILLHSPLFEPTLNLQKNLDPSTWQRPEACPDRNDAVFNSSAGLAASLLTLLAAIASFGIFKA